MVPCSAALLRAMGTASSCDRWVQLLLTILPLMRHELLLLLCRLLWLLLLLRQLLLLHQPLLSSICS